MTCNSSATKCVLTGANGFVGSRLKAYLQKRDFQVVDWTRRPVSGSCGAVFRLGQEVLPVQFADATALVHCAYDFAPRKWSEVVAINVRGSEQLLHAAKAAGVARLVFISSLSAFAGCRSLYGRAKLEIEKTALSLGALVVRPGLVYGDQPGGVFGGLVNQVRKARVIPLLRGGRQPQYLVHGDDLGAIVARYLNGEISAPAHPVTLAHEHPWPMRELLLQISAALNREVRFVSVPWRLAWAGIKTLEIVRLPAPFRSDSLIGYIYQNPAPDFSPAQRLQAECRPLRITKAMLE
jgi:nucleoside-diphosphate-sugar epimerase